MFCVVLLLESVLPATLGWGHDGAAERGRGGGRGAERAAERAGGSSNNDSGTDASGPAFLIYHILGVRRHAVGRAPAVIGDGPRVGQGVMADVCVIMCVRVLPISGRAMRAPPPPAFPTLTTIPRRNAVSRAATRTPTRHQAPVPRSARACELGAQGGGGQCGRRGREVGSGGGAS